MIENFQSLSSVTRKFKIQSPILWQPNLFLITMHNGGKVVETDVTRPFCVGCHVGICLHTFVMFVKMDTRKSLARLESPLLQLVTKNRFQSPILQRLKFFGHHRIGTWCCHMKKITIFVFFTIHFAHVAFS
jgi:hypothetical protein